MTMRNHEKALEKDEITCPYCWEIFITKSSYRGWGVWAKTQFDAHKNACKEKQQVLKDIEICKTKAEMYHCLNCKRYMKECPWIQNK